MPHRFRISHDSQALFLTGSRYLKLYGEGELHPPESSEGWFSWTG
jgi:hypothetical protein